MPKKNRGAGRSSHCSATPKVRPSQMEDSPPADNTVAAGEDQERKFKEWEEAVCPICIEIPHNAVMLRCSSKGCRPYICNTGYRHSDCLKKLFETWTGISRTCPFCRGSIKGWEVIDSAARKYMNSKQRSCFSCEFSGDYAELRKHVRSEHPLVRPRDVDPTSREAWRRVEAEDLAASLGEGSIGNDVAMAEAVMEVRAPSVDPRYPLSRVRTLLISSFEQAARDIFDTDSTSSQPSFLEWTPSPSTPSPSMLRLSRRLAAAAARRRANAQPCNVTSRRMLRGPRNF